MKRQHQRHSVEPWLDGGVFHGDGSSLPASASRSSRNISFPSCSPSRAVQRPTYQLQDRSPNVVRGGADGNGAGELFRRRRTISTFEGVRLALQCRRPHMAAIAPSFSSLAATESSSCSRSDAELSDAVPQDPCCSARAGRHSRSQADCRGSEGDARAIPQTASCN